MASVGLRELRRSAREVLQRVEAGETIEVTDRGRPVAVLAPIPTGSRLEQLRAAGELIPSEADFSNMPEPLPLIPGRPLPSEVLARMRSDER